MINVLYVSVKANQNIATIIQVHTRPAILYGLEIVIGLGAGSYTQAAFAVIQAVIAPSEAADGLTLMLLGSSNPVLVSENLLQWTSSTPWNDPWTIHHRRNFR